MLPIPSFTKNILSILLLLLNVTFLQGITISTSVTQVSCNGGNDGTITINVTSGSPNYEYYLYDKNPIPGPAVLLDQSGSTGAASWIFSTNITARSYYIIVVDAVGQTGGPITITEPAALSGGTIGSNQSVCPTGNPNLLTSSVDPSGGTGAWTYDWEYQNNCSGGWTSLSVNALTYDPPVIPNTRCYRRKATRGTCGTVYSNTITITVNNAVSGGTIGPATQSVCYSTGNPGAFASSPLVTGDPSGGSGVWVYDWEYSDNGGALWNPLGVNSLTYDAPAGLTANRIYRRKATNDCGTGYSNTVTVTVYGQVVGGTIAFANAATDSICSGGNPSDFSNGVSPSGGDNVFTYRWEYSDNSGGSWTQIAGASGANITYVTPTGLLATRQYRRSATNATCGVTVYSNVLTITVSQFTASSISVEKGLTCNESSDGKLKANVTGGISPYTYLWSAGAASQTTQIANNIKIGNYTVAITDKVGCTVSPGIVFTRAFYPDSIPPVLSVTSVNVTNTCTGFNNGAITINASGGVPVLNYAIFNTTLLDSTSHVANSFASLPSAIYRTWVIDSRGCKKRGTDANIVANPLPNITYTLSDPTICNGASATITQSNSEIGVNYQLQLVSTSANVGAAVAGTGAGISFIVNPGSTTIYKVVASNGTTGCTATLTDQSTVTVNPLPNITYTLSDPTICNGASATITQSNSEVGVNYQLQLVSTSANVGASVAGTGAGISFTVNPGSTTQYKVVATNGTTGCTATLTDQSTVTVNPLPNITYTLSDPSICNGASATITQSNSEVGINYQLQLVSTSANVGAPVAGTGAGISFTVNPGSTTIYKVVATNGTTGCTATITDQSTVTVNPLPNITYTLSDPTICNGASATITQSNSEAGVNYQLQLVATSANVGAPVAGTGAGISFTVNPGSTTQYKVVATNGTTGCTATLTDQSTVTVNPLPNITYTLSDPTICNGASATITQSNSEIGINYQLQLVSTSANVGAPVAGTGAGISFTVSPGSTTIYKVVATNGTTGCTATLTDQSTVTVNPLPNITYTLSDPTICNGASATITQSNSEIGVNYQLQLVSTSANVGAPVAGTGAGISFTVNPGSTTIYKVVATNGTTGCTATLTDQSTVTVNPLPNITYTLSDPTICNGASATITQSNSEVGINYQLQLVSTSANVGTPVAGTGAGISFTVSPGSTTIYKVVASNGGTGCTATITDQSTVTVNPLPNITYTLSDPGICVGSNATINQSNSEVGVNYQLQLVSTSANVGVAVAGTGAGISFTVNPGSTTQYKVVATNGTTGCTATLTDQSTVTVNPLPNITYTLSDPTICNGASATITQSNSEIGVNYQLQLVATSANVGAPVAGTGAGISFTVNPGSTTIYKVVATNGTTGCTATLTDQSTVTVNPLPNITYTLSDPTICNGASATINQSNSEAGINYQLQLVSTSANVGAPVAGTGAGISFTVNPGSTTQYKVVATNGTTGCTATLTDQSTVTVNPLPNITYTLSDPGICVGSNATINQSNSEVGVNYQLQLVATSANVGVAVAGTGAGISFTVNPGSTTQYKVVATNGTTGCTATLTDQSTVTVNPLPNITYTLSDPTICNGASATINQSGSQAGINYQLQLVSTSANVGAPVAGTGAGISFTVSPGSTTIYKVVASNGGTGCTATITDQSTVTVNPLPNITYTLSDPGICVGSNATINQNNSEVGVNYQLQLVSTSANVGAPVAGTGAGISFTVNPGSTTQYKVVATNGTTGCTATITDQSTVTVNPLPNITYTLSDPTICNGASATITQSNSEAGVNYQLQLVATSANVGAPVAGTGAGISFTVNPGSTTQYKVVATNGTTGCTATLTDQSNVTVNPLPIVYNVSGGGSYCAGDPGVSIGLSNSEIGIDYELFINGIASGNVVAGNGIAIDFGNQTVAGIYTIVATNAITSCQENMNGSATVIISPLPDNTLVVSDPEICEGSIASIIVTNSELNTNYQLRLNIDNSLIGTPIAGTGNNISIDISPVISTIYNVLAIKTDGTACEIQLADLANVTVNSLPTAAISPDPAEVCSGSGLLLNGNPAGGSGVFITHNWTGTGAIYLDNVSIEGPEFKSAIAGLYQLTYTVTDDKGCSASSTITLNNEESPVVFAGADSKICYEGDYTISDANVTNFNSFQWTTLGDGAFDDATILNPIYTPGFGDKSAGSVKLVLEAVGNGPCASVTDTMTLTIAPELKAAIGSPAPFIIGANTKINVCISTQNHIIPEDMGFYLVAPDGKTIMTLKKAPFEYNGLVSCNGNLWVDAQDLCFTNDGFTANDSLDICNPAITTMTGLHGATGDWTKLYGLNPAEGGWAVMVKDTFDFYFPVNQPFDGSIIRATISFSDTATATNEIATVTFDSDVVDIPIHQNSRTSYQVPLGLRTKCSNSCDATAIVSVTGGTPPYTSFQWSDPIIPASDSVDLCKGIFTVTVTDALGCTTTATVEVTSPSPITVDNIVFTDTLACNGDSTNVTVTAHGGTSTLRYTLDGTNFKKTGQAFTGIKAGTYNISIFDVNDCRKDTTITIVQPSVIAIDSLKSKNISCNGDASGEIHIYASGGTEPHEFILSNGVKNNTGDFINLIPGSYFVKVTDKNGCDTVTSNPVIITEPMALVVDSLKSGNITCFGNNDGTITIFASGGTSPLRYSIDGGLTFLPDSSFTALIPGTYNPVVRDTNNCEVIYVPVIITEPAAIVIDQVNTTDVTSCYGTPEGSITIIASGGTGALEYSLDGITFQLNGIFNNIPGGTYNIVVRDATGCEKTQVVIVNQPPQIIITNLTYTNVSGLTKGTIHVEATGGVGALTYSIGGLYQASGDFIDLDPGKYYVNVRDSMPCTITDSVYISDLVVNVQKLDVKCFGDSTGYIILTTVSGGSTINYSIDGGVTSQDSGKFFKLVTGMYDIKVWDETGATFQTAVAIGTGAEIKINAILESPVTTCAGDNAGALLILAEGGSGSLKYSVDNGLTYKAANLFNNLIAGNYTVVVSDDSSCFVSKAASIIEPPVIAISTTTTQVMGKIKGSVHVVASGGTGSLQYSLDGVAYQASPDFADLVVGNYTIYVKDDNGCVKTALFDITEASTTISFIKTNACKGDDGAIAIVCADCDINTQYSIDNGATFQPAQLFGNLTAGTYPVVVKYGSGTLYSIDVVITKPDASASIVPPSCTKFFNDGALDLTLTDATAVAYLWSNGETTEDLTSITGGNYSVIVSTTEGCTINKSFVVTGIQTVTADAGINVSVCPGTSVELNATGGSTYFWSPPMGLSAQNVQKPIATPLNDMTYIVKVTEGNCFDIDSVRVSIYPTLGLYAGRDTSVGEGNILQLEIQGGDFSQYIWNPSDFLTDAGSRNPIFTAVDLPSDSMTYIVVGITEFGCIESDTIVIKVAGKVEVFSGFTPNNDGKNDVWIIRNAEFYPEIKVSVFNRWGEKIFYSKGYDNSSKVFDGTRNGRDLPDGTYYYIIELTGSLPVTGPLTIVR